MLKRWFFFLLAIGSCSEKPSATESATESHYQNSGVFLEGKIPLDENRTLAMEISLFEGDMVGEGTYKLAEFIEEKSILTPITETTGHYITSRREAKLIISLLKSSSRADVIRSSYTTNANGYRILREENLRSTDLLLQRMDDDRYTMLSPTGDPVTDEITHQIYRRTSDLFTIEGYFRHLGDSAHFFEVNTEQQWPISKMGAYPLATQQYYQLSVGKFEKVYLKGVAFTVNMPGHNGRKSLVIKRLIQMSNVPN